MGLASPVPATPQQGVDELDTPVLCVDLHVMEANIADLVSQCRKFNVGWRPHTKSHKSPIISRQLLEAGALGVTCAKLGEAEVMAAGGVHDILIANLIVGAAKLRRLRMLREIADPIVCVDHQDQVVALSEAFAGAEHTLRVLVEVDIGLHRVGVQPGEPTVSLARMVEQSAGLELAGVMGYEGHLLCVEDPAKKEQQIGEALALLADQKDQLFQYGLPCPIVSCGGTGSFVYSIRQPGITEVQAGGGILMDAFYRDRCQVTQWDFALTVLVTVVSRPTPERAIIDAGRKSMDANTHQPFVLGRDDIEVQNLSAEHGTLRLTGAAQSLRIGDRLRIVPGYSDMTCVLHNHLIALRDDRVESVIPIAGRGRLQ